MIDITGRRLDTVDKQNPEKVGYWRKTRPGEGRVLMMNREKVEF